MIEIVPVANPRLPTVHDVLPYLREIDRTRQYANHGPLVRRFEARLAQRFGAPSDDLVALVSSGTAALAAIFAALEIAPGALCMIPSWTFAATAHAALTAGLVPWLVDVDPADGVLTPERALALVPSAPGPLGAIVTVSPFGLPFTTEGWAAFRERTGIPVVIDAAAAFDSVRESSIPTAVSLHATKALGVGEGGVVLWNDRSGIRAVRERTNFGFAGRREAMSAATNAKPSEYTAAVGLAALDQWPATRADFQRVAAQYRRALGERADVAFQRGYGERWISSTVIVQLAPGMLRRVEGALQERGIETRRWWASGLAKQPAFRRFPRTLLPVTENLAETTIGLPCARDLASSTIETIAEIVIQAVTGAKRPRAHSA